MTTPKFLYGHTEAVTSGNQLFKLYHRPEDLNISRQGVHDAVKRATKILEDYETKLGLMEKFNNNNRLLNDINLKMMDLSQIVDHDEKLLRQKVKETVEIVMNDIEEMIE